MGEHVVGLGDLCAQVWVGMEAYLAGVQPQAEQIRERNNLHLSFFSALAQCIEDDGHRVCAVGISQRLLQVLQGYLDNIQVDVPRPQELVCAVTEALAQEEGEPDRARLIRFEREAHERAGQMYGVDEADYATFVTHLREYIRVTYEGAVAA